MLWRLLSVIMIILSPEVAHAVTLWETYSVDRFGTMVEAPSDWTEQKSADGGEYQFTSPDGKAIIVVSGGLNALDTISNAFGIYEKPQPGETITDRHLDKWGITISGKKDGRFFLRRSMLSCDNKLWNSVSIEYPPSQKNRFEPITNVVTRSLRFRLQSSTEVKECKS